MLKTAVPQTYSIEISNQCQCKCTGCSKTFIKSGKKEMDFPVFESLVKKIKPFAKNIRITGGEPTLNRDLYTMISFLEKQRIYFSIFTNGIWKNPDELVKKLSTKQYFRGLLISFHGDSLESNRVFNPYLSKEDFKKIKSNIIFSSDKIKTHINCVLNKINKDQMESLYEFKIKNKISGITYSRYIGNQKELKITPEELKKAVCRINGFPENEKMLLGNVVPQCFIKNSSGCQAGVNYCAIRTDAKVLPCSHSRKILGDIIKESIENIWEKKKRKDWINKFTNKKCHKCKYMMICQGGCKAEAELNKKNFDPLFQDAQ